MLGLSGGERISTIHRTVLAQYRIMADRQASRQTLRQHIPRLCIALRE